MTHQIVLALNTTKYLTMLILTTDYNILCPWFILHKFAGMKVGALGPVVQSVVSLTSSLRVISLTILADSIYNILIFFAEKM